MKHNNNKTVARSVQLLAATTNTADTVSLAHDIAAQG
jgi:hypothetical protein